MGDNYKCPVCEKWKPYYEFAGKGVVKCNNCKAQIKEMVRSTGGGYY